MSTEALIILVQGKEGILANLTYFTFLVHEFPYPSLRQNLSSVAMEGNWKRVDTWNGLGEVTAFVTYTNCKRISVPLLMIGGVVTRKKVGRGSKERRAQKGRAATHFLPCGHCPSAVSWKRSPHEVLTRKVNEI